MNYYDELINKLDTLISNNQYEEAKSIILNELSISYIPKDFENKLQDYLSNINDATKVYKSLTDEDILDYLYKDGNHQLIAVDELNKRNLRDYIDVCERYLKEGTYKNSKVLLIDSLIRQEINHDFEYVNECSLLTFNPSKLKPIENSDGYIAAYKLLSDTYMKEPSMLKIALDLLYKECIMYLPKLANNTEGIICANKIIIYVNDAFNAK